MNISTQKKVIKKKTRVCRHDREPSFNETFRFSLSPAGHSLQVPGRAPYRLSLFTSVAFAVCYSVTGRVCANHTPVAAEKSSTLRGACTQGPRLPGSPHPAASSALLASLWPVLCPTELTVPCPGWPHLYYSPMSVVSWSPAHCCGTLAFILSCCCQTGFLSDLRRPEIIQSLQSGFELNGFVSAYIPFHSPDLRAAQAHSAWGRTSALGHGHFFPIRPPSCSSPPIAPLPLSPTGPGDSWELWYNSPHQFTDPRLTLPGYKPWSVLHSNLST